MSGRATQETQRGEKDVTDKFCPIIKGPCAGKTCLNVKEVTEHWTIENMYNIEHHSRKMLRCREYPDEVWWELEEPWLDK